MKHKRAAALAAVILILFLYGAAIVCALLDSPLAESLLLTSLFCTIVIPAVLYGYMIAVRYFRNRNQS